MKKNHITIQEVSPRKSNSETEKFSPEKFSLWVRLLPILFFISYLNFTVFLFAYGPWPWPVSDGAQLYTFLLFAHLALFIGYVSTAFGKPRDYYAKWKIERIILVSLIANILLIIPTSVFRTGRAIPDFLGGLADLGSVYFESNLRRAEGGGLAEYIRIIIGPLLFLLFPLVVYYWRMLKWPVRGLSALSILGFLGIYVALGTNKMLADYVILPPFLLLARYFSHKAKPSWRRITIGVICGVLFFLVFLSFFTAGNISRSRTGKGINYFPITDTFADPDNFMVRYLPEDAKIGVIALTSYLSQGYYALYLSLKEPFVPMFGVGNSMFLYFNAVKITGIEEIKDMPYPVRIQKKGEWDAYGNWSTIYPWIASDVSFPGTIFVVFLIGRLFALSWIDTLRGSNPFAVAVLAQFIIMLFYFSANNQVLQSGEALTSFYGTLALWMFTRKKYVWRKQMHCQVP